MQNVAGTILLFHLENDDQPMKHGVSFVYGASAPFDMEMITLLARNDRELLLTRGKIAFICAIEGTWAQFRFLREQTGFNPACPICSPTTKGKEHE